MPVQAKKIDVLTKVERALRRDITRAAGSNDLVSQSEQSTLPEGVLSRVAGAIRERGGLGTRVDVDTLTRESSTAIATLLGQVNQAGGPGSGIISAREVQNLAALDADAGKRVARAYELITGRRVVLPQAPSPVVDGPDPLGRDVQAQLKGAVDGLSHWHESGDNGVDTRVLFLEGCPSPERALELLKTQVSVSPTKLLPGSGPAAVAAFRQTAGSDLEDWRQTFYDGGAVPASDENTDAMKAFDGAVAASFAPLSEVRRAKGDDNEGYLLGRCADGFIAVVVWPYRDG